LVVYQIPFTGKAGKRERRRPGTAARDFKVFHDDYVFLREKDGLERNNEEDRGE